MSMDAELGPQLLNAAENEDHVVAASMIRGGTFIVFQQVDPDNDGYAEDEDGNFSVVLADVDDDTAVVCFSDEDSAHHFAENIVSGDVPEGFELPAFTLDGASLLDGLPAECGLLVNPGAECECYFAPGTLESSE